MRPGRLRRRETPALLVPSERSPSLPPRGCAVSGKLAGGDYRQVTRSLRLVPDGRGGGDRGGGKAHQDRGPVADRARDVERPAVGLEQMLDDGQPEAGAAEGAGARLVDPEEALGEPREVLSRDADA